jgi:hypothetical protein
LCSPPLPGDSPIVVATASGRSAEVPLVGEFEFEFQIFDRFNTSCILKKYSAMFVISVFRFYDFVVSEELWK